MIKKGLLCAALAATLLVGCQQEEKSNNDYDFDAYIAELLEERESASYKEDYDIKVSNVRPSDSGSLKKVMGKITNNGNEYIDEIVDMAIFDRQGNLLTVRPYILEVEPYGSVYFEEIVGVDTADAYSVEISF